MPTAIVDRGALVHNLELLRSRLVPGCRLLATVKANAYGHGAVEVARVLQAAGVEWFGVATPLEALELRRAGIGGRILLLGPVYAHVEELLEAGIELTVAGPESLEAAARAATATPAKVHLKVDTGMGRLGSSAPGALELARAIDRQPRLRLQAVWTHFASADESDRTFTEGQIESFEGLLAALERDSLRPPLVHAANSAGLLAYPEAHFDLVRPGIVLYGYPPSQALAHLEPRLRPVMTITAPVTFVKRVSTGTPISYGVSWRAERDTTIATVRFGYADGYPRRLANLGWARLGRERVAVAGRICMDQLMLDVCDLTVEVGDRVTLLGPEGPMAGELGELAGTVSYEILTSVSPRVARRYLG